MSGRAPSVDTEEPLLKRLKTKEEKNEQSRVRMARLRRREREIALDRVGVARYGMQLYSRANVVRVYCNIYIRHLCWGRIFSTVEASPWYFRRRCFQIALILSYDTV